MAKKKVYWPSWRYGPGGQSAIFQKAEDVPEGWVSHPSEVEETDAKPTPPKSNRRKKKDEPAPPLTAPPSSPVVDEELRQKLLQEANELFEGVPADASIETLQELLKED